MDSKPAIGTRMLLGTLTQSHGPLRVQQYSISNAFAPKLGGTERRLAHPPIRALRARGERDGRQWPLRRQQMLPF